jgi:hypothetical protein
MGKNSLAMISAESLVIEEEITGPWTPKEF